MRLRSVLSLVAAGGWLFAGCGRPDAPVPAAESAAPPSPTVHLDHALPRLPTVRLWLGSVELNAEVCLTVPQVATGLMFRESIGTNEAMLFVFRGPDRRSFYMKNVKFPIAAAYIDPDGAIQEIVQLKAFDTNAVPSQAVNIQFVLETAPDFFTRQGLGPGTVITTPQGRLREVLARRSQVW